MNLLADNDKSTTNNKKRKLNMMALSKLDNIIDRDNDSIIDDTFSNDSVLSLDDISIESKEVSETEIQESSDGTALESMNKMLDNILLSSKVNNTSKPNKFTTNSVSNVHTESIRKPELQNTQYLNLNDILYTTNNLSVKVLRHIPSFENPTGYVCDFMNNHYILKWYNKDYCSNLKNLKESFEKISVDANSPKYYLKPKAITKSKDDGSFGCIYTDTTHDCFALKDIINGYAIECDVEDNPVRRQVKFKSMQSMMMACINIINIFEELNSKNLHIYSFSDEDMFININTGEILWNIVQYVSNEEQRTINVDTKCTYLAPEVLDGTELPNSNSDVYTLSIILFRILFHDHPLEGKSIIDDISCMFRPNMQYYSSKAVFIFNPNDTSNRAVRGVNYTVLSMWEKYPIYLRDAFVDTFCNYIFSPDERYTTQDWIKILLHLKCDILPCICGRKDFAFLYEFTQEAFYKCQRCGSKYHSLYFIKRGFDIPIYTGNIVYTTFLKDNIPNIQEPMGEIIENKINTNLNGIKNVSNLEWICTSSNGTTKTIKKDGVIPIFEGTVIDVGGSIAQFDFINSKNK